MSAINQVALVTPVFLGATSAAFYTAPTGTSAKIGRAVFSNTDTAVHTITVNIGASAAASNQLINTRSLAPGETYVSPELAGQVLPPGSGIRAQADTAGFVVIAVSGLTIVG